MCPVRPYRESEWTNQDSRAATLHFYGKIEEKKNLIKNSFETGLEWRRRFDMQLLRQVFDLNAAQKIRFKGHPEITLH